MWKVITWIVVIIIVVGGIWYFVSQTSPSTTAPAGTDTQTTAVAPQGSTAESGTSDAQLQADLNASDLQIQSAGSAGASAASFSDTPVTQTE